MLPPYRTPNRLTMDANDPNRRQSVRMRIGSAPAPEQRPFLLAQFAPSCSPQDVNVTWHLARTRAKLYRYDNGKPTRLSTPQDDTQGEWINCKLWATSKALHKANFWISWNDETRTVNRRGDGSALAKLRPQLYESVLAYFREANNELREELDWLHVVSREPSGAIAVELEPLSRLLWIDEPRSHIFATSEMTRVREMAGLLGRERGMKFTAKALDGPMAGFIEVTRTA
jgi:hypothetical protein